MGVICKSGTKPCGKTCIPREYDCQVAARPSLKREVTQALLTGAASTGGAIAITEGYKKAKKWWLKSQSARNATKKVVQNLDSGRLDFQGRLNCGPGTYQCGNRCIPRDNKCGIRTGRKIGRAGLGIAAAGLAAGTVGAASNNKSLMLAGTLASAIGNTAQLYGSQKIAEGYASQGENTRATLYRALAIGSGVKAAMGGVTTAARIRNIKAYTGQKREVAPL